MTMCALKLRCAGTTWEWKWDIIDMICRATPHLQAKQRARHTDAAITEGAGRMFFKNLHYNSCRPHKPHEDAVKVFAVEVRANLISGALYFSLWWMEINVRQGCTWCKMAGLSGYKLYKMTASITALSYGGKFEKKTCEGRKTQALWCNPFNAVFNGCLEPGNTASGIIHVYRRFKACPFGKSTVK